MDAFWQAEICELYLIPNSLNRNAVFDIIYTEYAVNRKGLDRLLRCIDRDLLLYHKLCQDRGYDLPVLFIETIAEGGCLVCDAQDKCFLGSRHGRGKRPHMALDRPNALLIDIAPEFPCGYC